MDVLNGYVDLQFFKELNGAVHSLRCCPTVRRSALFYTTFFICMELQVMVIQLYPVIPLHRPQSHGDMVGAMFKGPVGQWIRLVDIPVWVRWRIWPFELDWCPYSRCSFRAFRRRLSGTGLFQVRRIGSSRCWLFALY